MPGSRERGARVAVAPGCDRRRAQARRAVARAARACRHHATRVDVTLEGLDARSRIKARCAGRYPPDGARRRPRRIRDQRRAAGRRARRAAAGGRARLHRRPQREVARACRGPHGAVARLLPGGGPTGCLGFLGGHPAGGRGMRSSVRRIAAHPRRAGSGRRNASSPRTDARRRPRGCDP